MIPQYLITAGAMTADSTSLTDAGLPIAVRVDLRLNQFNTALVQLALPPSKTVAIGDAVTIELGDADNGTELVFTGVVSELRQTVSGYGIWCTSALQALTRIRASKFYEKQKAGDIVSDLASIAELSTGSVEAGIDYPAYAIGGDRHLWAHAMAIAARDGFDLYADADDALVMAAYSGSPSHELRYGAEIVDYYAEEKAAALDGVEVYGESPASLGEGDKAYSWLTKQEVKGNAGQSSGNVLRISDSSIRNQDAAGSMAEKLLAANSVLKSGWVEALGAPQAVLGGAITLTDIPDGPDGDFKITAVRHALDKRRGFLTKVYWMEA
jgi:hypothetical protein